MQQEHKNSGAIGTLPVGILSMTEARWKDCGNLFLVWESLTISMAESSAIVPRTDERTPMETHWSKDRSFHHFGSLPRLRTAGGISVTIDDLTTMGQVICDGGKSSQGNQILPEAWINEIIDSGGDREAWKLGEFASLLPKRSYHNKWWQSGNSDQVIYALGTHGQYLYINPLQIW